MTADTIALSPRHERFVLEYLKDANATQAYIRAGYSPRGAQPSASKLLRDPRIADAVAAGRQRIAQALEVDATRLAQEYARIAYANVSDFVSTDENGCLRFDLEKASEAQRAGIVELKLSNHRDPEKQGVTLKLGKLQALKELTKNLGVLGKKPAPGLTPEDRHRYEERHAADRCAVEASNERYASIVKRLGEVQAALAQAEQKAERADAAEAPAQQPPEQGEAQPPANAEPQQPAVEPGMPTEPMPDHRPGLYPTAKFIFSGGRDHGLGPDSADALRTMKPGGFPGWDR